MPNLPHQKCPVIRAHKNHVTTIVSPERTPGYAPLQKQLITKFHRIFSANKCQISGSRAKNRQKKKKNTLNTFQLRMSGVFIHCHVWEGVCRSDHLKAFPCTYNLLFSLFFFYFFSYVSKNRQISWITQLLAANRAHHTLGYSIMIGVGFGCPDICRHASDTLVVSHK